MKKIGLLMLALAGILNAAEYATYYIRDAEGNVIMEYDENGEVKHINIHGLDLIGRYEPDDNGVITWVSGGVAQSKTFNSIAGALTHVIREGDPAIQEVLTINADEQVVNLYVTRDNITLEAGDNGGTPFAPVLAYRTKGSVPQDQFHLNGQGRVAEGPEGLVIDGVDLLVTNKEAKENILVIKGDVVLRNSAIGIEDQGIWAESGSSYRKLVSTTVAEGNSTVCVTLYPATFDYAKAAPDGSDLVFYSEDNGSALAAERTEWVQHGVSRFWFDTNESAVWIYY